MNFVGRIRQLRQASIHTTLVMALATTFTMLLSVLPQARAMQGLALFFYALAIANWHIVYGIDNDQRAIQALWPNEP
jgi:hypothetical protein